MQPSQHKLNARPPTSTVALVWYRHATNASHGRTASASNGNARAFLAPRLYAHIHTFSRFKRLRKNSESHPNTYMEFRTRRTRGGRPAAAGWRTGEKTPNGRRPQQRGRAMRRHPRRVPATKVIARPSTETSAKEPDSAGTRTARPSRRSAADGRSGSPAAQPSGGGNRSNMTPAARARD